MPNEPVHKAAQKRGQSRADGQGHIAGIGVIGQAQAGHHIDRPGMKPIVQKRITISRGDGLLAIWRDGSADRLRV